MESYLAWVLAGFGLVIAELLSGTFYLLMLGIAAFGGAAAAWAGLGFPAQAFAAGVIAGVGSWMVHVYHAKNARQQMKPMDHAQPVTFEQWVNQDARLARVRYRGATWEARVEGDAAIDPGGMLYILTADGNTLTVSKTRPA
jgi:membrane protein implicated in regulation of membrane protease activity